MYTSPSKPLISRRTLIFLVGIAFAEASMSMPLVQVPVYLRELGAGIREIGLFFTISMVFSLTLRILGGWLADAVDRLRVITVGSLVGVLTFVAYALAPSWQTALLGPALLAITTSLTIPAYFAYITEQTQEGARGRVFGIAQTIRAATWIAAPPLGGLLAQSFGYRSMFTAASVSYGFAAIIFILLVRSGPLVVGAARRVNLISLRTSLSEMLGLFLAGGVVTWLLILDGVRDIAFELSFDLMPVFLSDIAGFNKVGIGLLDGIFGLAHAVAIYPSGWLVDKTNERLTIVLGLIVLIASRLIFAFATSFWGFAISWTLLAIGGGMLHPAGQSLISKSVPRHLLGITYGVFATSLGIFSLPAPWIGSQLWTYLNPRAPFLLTVILGSLVVLPAWFKLRPPTETSRSQEPAQA